MFYILFVIHYQIIYHKFEQSILFSPNFDSIAVKLAVDLSLIKQMYDKEFSEILELFTGAAFSEIRFY